MNPCSGEDLRDGLGAVVRSRGALAPDLAGHLRQALRQRTAARRRAAVQPRDRGAYPTGSTFKPITALAGLSTGADLRPGDVIDDNGCITIGREKREVCNAKKQALGPVNLRAAISKSSDVYFYKLGLRLNYEPGQPLQKWARRLGLGHTTGIEVPGEFGGLVPDKAWRARLADKERACRKRRNISLLAAPQAAAAKGCGISDMRPWSEGDEVNLAVGQGDLQATPLQMAVAYGALENGGRRVRPHLGAAVEDSGGRLLQRIEPGSSRKVAFDPANLKAIQDGLHDVTTNGTAAPVFKGWPQNRYPVYGKTGTAVRNNQPNDQAWFAAYVPDPKRPIVVAATVENGGFGAVAAAPVVKTMLRTGSTCRSRYTRHVHDLLMPSDPATTPIRDATDAPPQARPRAGRRAIRLPFDPVLLLAVIGICIGSLVTIAGATADDIAGDPNYYVERQAVYFVVGALAAAVLTRIDYSRLREAKYVIYGLLIATILAVQALGSVARGSRRAIDLGFFSFQASELGKVLLVVALAGFVTDRARRVQARDTTARVMLITPVPAALVIIQPDLGSGLVYIVIGPATPFASAPDGGTSVAPPRARRRGRHRSPSWSRPRWA